jgi:Family of unknown function (DUF5362)
MENNELLDLDMQSASQDGLTSEEKNYLFTAAKWSKFLGIVGFIFTGLILVASIFVLSIGSSISGLESSSGMGVGSMFGMMGAFMGVIYIALAALYFFMSLYLYRFGTKMQAGLESSLTDNRTLGFKNLKSYFKLMGIVMAAILILYALVFLFGILSVLGR